VRTSTNTLNKAIAFFNERLLEDPEWEGVKNNLFIFETIKAYPEFEDQLISLTKQQELGLIEAQEYLDLSYKLAQEFISSKEN